MSIQQFGSDVLSALQQHLAPGKVAFDGSFATGQFDEYSDVDIQAEVHQELKPEFFDSLIRCLQKRFGSLTVRYNPDQKDNRMAQDLKINFHDYPVFWRIDLNITSDRDYPTKLPTPFPEWSVATSAFWNVVWAVKRSKRGKDDEADHYLACACEKLGRSVLCYSDQNAATVLSEIAGTPDFDDVLLQKLQCEIGNQQDAPSDADKPRH
jgi:hypothetical protein